jgi:hypothetical protein
LLLLQTDVSPGELILAAKEGEMLDASQFWQPCDTAPPPVTAEEIEKWQADFGVQLPVILARALMVQNGGAVRGSAVLIEALEQFTPLDDEQWDDVWTDDQTVSTDRSRQFYIGESVGVGVVLDYSAGSEPGILLLHHELGRELRDHGIRSFEELLATARHEENCE